MTIHHATVKKAAKLGILLTEIEIDGETISQGHWADGNKKFLSRDPKVALGVAALAKALKLEYPSLSIEGVSGVEGVEGVEGVSSAEDLFGFVCYGRDAEGGQYVLLETQAIPSLAELLDLAAEADIDPELGFNENRGVVVPPQYKETYAARGNRNHNGDWLNLQLEAKMVDEDGHLILTDYQQFLADNGVEFTGKWADLPNSGAGGWIGRYKMAGNGKVRHIMAGRGTLILEGEVIKAPIAYLEHLLEIHPNVTVEWGE